MLGHPYALEEIITGPGTKVHGVSCSKYDLAFLSFLIRCHASRNCAGNLRRNALAAEHSALHASEILLLRKVAAEEEVGHSRFLVGTEVIHAWPRPVDRLRDTH